MGLYMFFYVSINYQLNDFNWNAHYCLGVYLTCTNESLVSNWYVGNVWWMSITYVCGNSCSNIIVSLYIYRPHAFHLGDQLHY